MKTAVNLRTNIRKSHYQLSPGIINRRDIDIFNLQKLFKSHRADFKKIKDEKKYDIVTKNEVHSKCEMLTAEKKGQDKFENYVSERILASSKISICAPIKRKNISVFIAHLQKTKRKDRGRSAEGSSYRLFCKICAMLVKNGVIIEDVVSS